MMIKKLYLKLVMLEIIPHLHGYLVPQSIAGEVVPLVVIITIGQINIISRRYVVWLMFKPLLITMMHFNDVMQDCSSYRDLHLISHLMECSNMQNREPLLKNS